MRHGYVVVYQDCRGRYKSEGEFTKYLGDGERRLRHRAPGSSGQPWCNGKVGTMGLSYAAHTQAALACLDPPGLAGMFLDSGGFSNAYQGGIRQGGAFELKQATWAYQPGAGKPGRGRATPRARAALEAEDIRDWFTRMPWRRGHSPVPLGAGIRGLPVRAVGRTAPSTTTGSSSGIYAAGFYDAFADVPMVHMSSWYDPYPRTATENYHRPVEAGSGPVRLILGPWTHGDRS